MVIAERVTVGLTLETLAAEVDSGSIDTVLIAFPDMQGRLQGKRLHARFFLDECGKSWQ